MEILKIKLSELTPDPDNAKEHPEGQIDQIMESIRRWGFNDPIGVWGDENVIVEGHGRYEALRRLGYKEVECIRLDQLTDEERKAYALVHNQTNMVTGFIPEKLDLNLASIGEIDMSLFGFDNDNTLHEWFSSGDTGEAEEGEEEYQEFLDKFEAKHTTDDCYTPDKVYDAVAEWVANAYQLDPEDFVRPFYPGGGLPEREVQAPRRRRR